MKYEKLGLVLVTMTIGCAACGTETPSTAADSGVTTPDLDSGTNTTADAGSVTDAGESPALTADVLCGYSGQGDQQLVYEHADPLTGTVTQIDETLAYDFAWTCDATERTITGNGVPNHSVTNGSFASQVSAQTVSFSMTLSPQIAATATPIKEPGYALNSVKFDPATAGTCPDAATVLSDCDEGMGSDQWRMVATPGNVSPWKFGFGVDENDAHVQPGGTYHYHGNPIGLVAALNSDFDTSMTLVGWAKDGFPIYSIYSHSDPTDGSSAVAKMQSSYQTISTVPADRPAVADFALGHFESDWEYVAGSGDLDECNGREGVTPEFPNGIYHYVTTETYPFVQRCVRGTAPAGGGPGGGGPGGGGPGGGG